MTRALLVFAIYMLSISCLVNGTANSRMDPTHHPTHRPTQFPTLHTEAPVSTNAPSLATKAPSLATKAPSLATKAPSRETDSPTLEIEPVETVAPSEFTGTEFPLPGAENLNGTVASNDQQAVATLVGTTVPFLGLAGIAFGVYRMRRKRSLSESRLASMQNAGFVGNMNNLEKRGSAYNPGFAGGAVGSSDQENQNARGPSMAQTTALPGMPVVGMFEDTNNRGSKSKRLMEMVLRSRETAAFATSPVQQYDVESGLSKEQIEEKVKRIATFGARAYGTSANGAGLKSIGQVIAKMRPNSTTGDSLMKPSQAVRESMQPSYQGFTASQLPGTPHHSLPERIVEDEPSDNIRFSQIPPPPMVDEEDTFEGDLPPPPPSRFSVPSLPSSLSMMRESIKQSSIKRVSIFGPRDSEPSLASTNSRVSTFRPKNMQSFS